MKKIFLTLSISLGSSFFTFSNAQISLYGMTARGGYRDFGTIFKISTDGNLNTIVRFDSSNGAAPASNLIQAINGNLYSTSVLGGINDSCVAICYSASGQLTVLFDFDTAGLDNPYGPLIQAKDTNLYGMTFGGGGTPKQNGSIYKITPTGKLVDLHDFSGAEGSSPYGGLIQATDGNFYGMNSGVESTGSSTLFRFTASGVLTPIVNFGLGEMPFGSLIQGSDGYLYGMTSRGGVNSDGRIFKCSTSGTITTIHSFNDTDGDEPEGSLIQATDGYLYGMTSYGGDSNVGVVFKCSTSGNYQILAQFNKSNGSNPQGSLMQASDGYLYGMTTYGGTYNLGTIFTLESGNNIVTMINFNDTNGANPLFGSLMEPKGPLGVNEVKNNQTISVYPNPFHNSTTVVVNTDGKHSLEVYDLTGRKLQFVEFTGKQYELSAQGLAKGMYFVRVFDELNALIGTSKIVVE